MDGQHRNLDTNHSQAPADADTNFRSQGVSVSMSTALSIEHVVVGDDPRKWSKARKYAIVAMISAASMISGLSSNIYNSAITQIESELHATSGELSLTLSLYILLQGVIPLFWSALVSLGLCLLGLIMAAAAKKIGVLIGMRCLQAVGSSAVFSIGAATLADLYEPSQRGAMMGIYYCAPLLGPSLGSIIGGALTQGFNWRATFWFLDSFRRERSLTYQLVLKRVQDQQTAKKNAGLARTRDATIASDGRATQHALANAIATDAEAQASSIPAEPIEKVKLSTGDTNPIRPIFYVLRRKNNFAILFTSGSSLRFHVQICSVTYTTSRSLARKYQYGALKIGLVSLAYGVGCLLGSILGGRYSDYVFRKLKAKNGGASYPEKRLQSTTFAIPFFPPAVIAYGGVCEKHVQIAAVCVMLFLSGFLQICVYASAFAYIVDANTGRSSSAAASNSFFRGVFAFVALEAAVSLQGAIGDGGMYSVWGGLMVVSELVILVWWEGRKWQEEGVAMEIGGIDEHKKTTVQES
ncbi:hypothetical protein AcV5_002046 [Taiwanofungus camphoratus]|nr:hypothetical protein AcV5_002046 [Antrodia cinnamomea]